MFRAKKRKRMNRWRPQDERRRRRGTLITSNRRRREKSLVNSTIKRREKMLHVQWVRCNHLDIRAHVHLIWPLLTEIRSYTHKTCQWFVLIAKYNNGSDSSSTIGLVLQSISSDFGKRPAESCTWRDLEWLELVLPARPSIHHRQSSVVCRYLVNFNGHSNHVIVLVRGQFIHSLSPICRHFQCKLNRPRLQCF